MRTLRLPEVRDCSLASSLPDLMSMTRRLRLKASPMVLSVPKTTRSAPTKRPICTEQSGPPPHCDTAKFLGSERAICTSTCGITAKPSIVAMLFLRSISRLRRSSFDMPRVPSSSTATRTALPSAGADPVADCAAASPALLLSPALALSPALGLPLSPRCVAGFPAPTTASASTRVASIDGAALTTAII